MPDPNQKDPKSADRMSERPQTPEPAAAQVTKIPQGQVAVMGLSPGAQRAAEPAPQSAPTFGPPAEAPKYSPYNAPTEIVPGGRYIRGATMRGGKLFGGEVVNAHGEVLATFAPDQENDGNVESGTKPEP